MHPRTLRERANQPHCGRHSLLESPATSQHAALDNTLTSFFAGATLTASHTPRLQPRTPPHSGFSTRTRHSTEHPTHTDGKCSNGNTIIALHRHVYGHFHCTSALGRSMLSVAEATSKISVIPTTRGTQSHMARHSLPSHRKRSTAQEVDTQVQSTDSTTRFGLPCSC